MTDETTQTAPAFTPDDMRYMRLALELGRRGLGRTAPNPAVGAVIVKDGVIVGRGWTQDHGRPHAEVEALARAKRAARGATMYVTLEPCSHHGQTPPCADAIIKAGKDAQAMYEKKADEENKKAIKAFEDHKVKVVSLTNAEYDQWIALAKKTSFARFDKEVPNGQKLIDEALSVK